jgi:hypothetical protein
MFVPRKPSSFATSIGAWRMFNKEPSIILSLYKERWAYSITMSMCPSVHVAVSTITLNPVMDFWSGIGHCTFVPLNFLPSVKPAWWSCKQQYHIMYGSEMLIFESYGYTFIEESNLVKNY